MVLRIGLTVVVFVLASCHAAEKVSLARVIDGDTVVVVLANQQTQTVRLLAVDSYETYKAECAAEKRLGEMIRQRLQQFLLANPYLILYDRVAYDVYGRALARLAAGSDATNLMDVSDWLKTNHWHKKDKTLCSKNERDNG